MVYCETALNITEHTFSTIYFARLTVFDNTVNTVQYVKLVILELYIKLNNITDSLSVGYIENHTEFKGINPIW